ncbi:glucoamylase family protein, partial [Ideonella sp.]|uniref:glucoamylase family protein n=1 Tax=Ideonella sp. TaxID=1929293 RepID=UPI003BB57F5D
MPLTAMGGLAGTLVALLLILPASEAVVAVVNRLISESARPRRLPRLALAEGIPATEQVLVVIPAMLTDTEEIDRLVHRLLLHHLANPERHAQYALLTDWADADGPHADDDDALLDHAAQAIEGLNARPDPTRMPDAAPRFVLLHRGRRFSQTEQRWIGWERKRGKLQQLAEALATGITRDFIDLGAVSRLASGTRHLLTLDSDTQLPPGRLRELVGLAAHPDNRPRYGADGRSVVAGYGVLQPRVVTPLPARSALTRFHWLFAGQGGIDPYSTASSEIYQDLFCEGSFSGKGLLNVQAMHQVLGTRLPDDCVLSHDLLEGAMLRCAAVMDVTLVEPAPFHADVAASRVHRWARGDWQLLPFLLAPRRWPLRAINRWKMIDNLRRSLVAPASLALQVLALAGVGLSPWVALALVGAALAAGPLMGAVAGFSPGRTDLAKRYFYRLALADLARAVGGGLWLLAMLLQHALHATDAIVRSLYRLLVSRRHLLEWTTAAAAQQGARHRLVDLLRQHRSVCGAALVLGLALHATGTPWPALSAALCLLWGAAPLWTWWVSRPGSACEDSPALPADQATLHGVARDTWRFFERCVSADDRHLPPDNLQTLPQDMLAHRTSPTNIGLYLLSAACAREFGWIGSMNLIERLEATLDSLLTLPRHRGHFLNWYDTQTGEALLPMYVSSVDSGNFSGHLLAVSQACRAWAASPFRPEPAQAALRHAAARLAQATLRGADGPPAQDDLTHLADLQADHQNTLASAQADERAAALPEVRRAASERLLALAHALEALAWEADFAFLYHPKRHLFHIGYRVAEQQLDTGFFDLLASEARLTSLLAIAKGDVPVRHWSALGRPFLVAGAKAGLRSWSGSMFEYLMPSLVLDEPEGSVLHDACHVALVEQQAWAAARHLPWGVSESAYAGQDHTLAYQYAPQGVPRLALRRTPPDEQVIAPYATALAAQLAPHAACLNLAALARLAPRGRYGFIEALDFTASRRSADACMPVSTFMSHHQGMSVVALANVLLDGVARRWCMAHPHIEAVASLMHEKAPREIAPLPALPSAPRSAAQLRHAPGLEREVMPGLAAVPPSHLLSNGRYSVALRANGAGWSRWGRLGISRAQDDALRDAQGHFFWLRRADRMVSLTQHPAPDASASYHSTFQADRVDFCTRWPDLQAEISVWVSPEDDIEFRQITLHNLSDEALPLELISAFEVTLAEPAGDQAHPAFSNLFLRAEWQPAQQALVFERKPRLATEAGALAAHFLSSTDPQLLSLCPLADRQRWRGRNQPTHQALGDFDRSLQIEASADAASLPPVALNTGLDPVCALSAQLRLAPRSKLVLTFATAAAEAAETLRAVMDKYQQASHVQRASLMSATLTGIRLRALRMGADNLAAAQSLSTALLLSLSRPAANPDETNASAQAASRSGCDRRLLWRFGISGDRPLLLLNVASIEGLGLLRALAQALRLWAWAGVACDLVVVNAEPASYLMPLQREAGMLRDRHLAEASPPGAALVASMHLLRATDLSPEELDTLEQLACVHLQADGRPLKHHVKRWLARHERALDLRQAGSQTALQAAPPARVAPAPPKGWFEPGTGRFRFATSDLGRPLRPWVNVLSNPNFGAQLSEAGGSSTWAVNSRLNQLTGWSNDPVADPPSEWLLLQDRRSLETWNLQASALGGKGQVYQLSHAQGISTIDHVRDTLEVQLSLCVDPVLAVKQWQLRIVNRGPRNRHLRLVGLAEWVMGAQRSDRQTVLTRHRPACGPAPCLALMATQREHAAGFGGGTVFLALTGGAEVREER